MLSDGIKWNDNYEFAENSVEEIRQFIDQWWISFIQARTDHSAAREKAINDVRASVTGSSEDISKAALALAEQKWPDKHGDGDSTLGAHCSSAARVYARHVAGNFQHVHRSLAIGVVGTAAKLKYDRRV